MPEAANGNAIGVTAFQDRGTGAEVWIPESRALRSVAICHGGSVIWPPEAELGQYVQTTTGVEGANCRLVIPIFGDIVSIKDKVGLTLFNFLLPVKAKASTSSLVVNARSASQVEEVENVSPVGAGNKGQNLGVTNNGASS